MSTDRARAAQAILSIPLFNELMDDIEKAEINAAIVSKYTDHEQRYGHMVAVRSIRALRSRIEAISQEGQSIDRRQAPA